MPWEKQGAEAYLKKGRVPPFACREGTMQGAFQVGDLDLEGRGHEPVRLFEAQIAPFKLMPPGS
jgi:hypothetical protein